MSKEEIDIKYYITVYETQKDPEILKNELKDLIDDCIKIQDSRISPQCIEGCHSITTLPKIDIQRRASLFDEVVFRDANYTGKGTISEGIITMITKRGVQVQLKIGEGQTPKQVFVKWDRIIELRNEI